MSMLIAQSALQVQPQPRMLAVGRCQHASCHHRITQRRCSSRRAQAAWQLGLGQQGGTWCHARLLCTFTEHGRGTAGRCYAASCVPFLFSFFLTRPTAGKHQLHQSACREPSMLATVGACVQPGVASVHCAILQKSPDGVSLFLRPVMETLVGRTFQHARHVQQSALPCSPSPAVLASSVPHRALPVLPFWDCTALACDLLCIWSPRDLLAVVVSGPDSLSDAVRAMQAQLRRRSRVRPVPRAGQEAHPEPWGEHGAGETRPPDHALPHKCVPRSACLCPSLPRLVITCSKGGTFKHARAADCCGCCH